jgi:predicted DCC family thiol-disulfide oxidoreductase YuxK
MGLVGRVIAPHPVLLFDGECGLCNRVVRRLLAFDRAGRLRFAPLQGPSAQRFLRAKGLPTQDFSTLVFVSDWEHPERTDYALRTTGVIAALRVCGGWGRGFAGVLALFPVSLRDWGYRMVAKWRLHVFGTGKACPLPRPEWAARFLA